MTINKRIGIPERGGHFEQSTLATLSTTHTILLFGICSGAITKQHFIMSDASGLFNGAAANEEGEYNEAIVFKCDVFKSVQAGR